MCTEPMYELFAPSTRCLNIRRNRHSFSVTASHARFPVVLSSTLAMVLGLDPAGKRSGISAPFCIEAQAVFRSGEKCPRDGSLASFKFDAQAVKSSDPRRDS